MNTAYELVDPARWQPAIHPHRRRVGGGPGDKGIFVVQRFVTPQLARVKAHTYRDPSRFGLPEPVHLRGANYKRSVDDILAASAGLTDAQKVKAEFFDNKFLGIGQATMAAGRAHDLTWTTVHLHFATAVAQFDDLIAAWYHKRRFDAVRPFSAVRHVYGNRKVTAWGGVGKGTVSDMPANEWASYLPVGDHPEYPSGSTTLCAAEAQAARRFLGDDVLEWKHSVPAGSLLTEPGLVPAKDFELNYGTWTEFVRECAISRVGWRHFRNTVETSMEWGKQFGDRPTSSRSGTSRARSGADPASAAAAAPPAAFPVPPAGGRHTAPWRGRPVPGGRTPPDERQRQNRRTRDRNRRCAERRTAGPAAYAAARFAEALPGPRPQHGQRHSRTSLPAWDTPPLRPQLLETIRTAATSDAGAARLRDHFSSMLVERVGEVVEAPRLNLNAVVVQVVGVIMTRYVMKMEPIASTSVDELVETFAPTIQRYLDA